MEASVSRELWITTDRPELEIIDGKTKVKPQAEEQDSGDLLRECQARLIAKRRALGLADDGGKCTDRAAVQTRGTLGQALRGIPALMAAEQAGKLEGGTYHPGLSPEHIYAKLYRRDIESEAFRALSWQAQKLWLCCFIPLTFFGGRYAGRCYPSPEKMQWYAQLDREQCQAAMLELLEAGLIVQDGELKNGTAVFSVQRP